MIRLRRNGNWLRLDYTDVLVVVGMSQEDARWEVEHLQRNKPELLIGLSIMAISADNFRAVEGLRVRYFHFSPRGWMSPNYVRIRSMLERSVEITYPWLFNNR